MYGPVAADHLKRPRNLGKLDHPDGVGHVEEPATDTQVTIYVRIARDASGTQIVRAASFRAFGCGGCIIAASVATEMASGKSVSAASRLDAATLLSALDEGLPAEQRYCAELVARALNLALTSGEDRTVRGE